MPAWLQNVLIYELAYYLAEDARPSSRAVLPPELEPSFHERFGRVARELDPQLVHRFRLRPYRPAFEDVLVHGFHDDAWHSRDLRCDRVDRVMGLQRITYRLRGPRPLERFRLDGRAVAPAWAKTRAITFFGRPVLDERLLWLPAGGPLEAELDGVVLPIRWEPRRDGDGTASATTLVAGQGPARRGRAAHVRAAVASARASAANAAVRAAAASPLGAPYRGAWVLMDQIREAGDNGEHLFEHLRRNRPDVNAWFVIKRGTPDWDRLRRIDEARVVAHGSFRWKVLMRRCAWLLASHANAAITAPRGLAGVVTTPGWRFGDLGHGVIKDDLSAQMNRIDIDLLAVSTAAEEASIVADGTGYCLTGKEVRLTGLARFDRLLATGGAVPEGERDLVIVAPTWRSWLLVPAGHARQRDVLEAVWHSDWLASWTRLLADPGLAAAVAARGLRVGLLPHPVMAPALRALELPPGVEWLSSAGNDVERHCGRCALLVTDYSSLAFDTALLDRPVVYYQFDRERVVGRGSHRPTRLLRRRARRLRSGRERPRRGRGGRHRGARGRGSPDAPIPGAHRPDVPRPGWSRLRAGRRRDRGARATCRGRTRRLEARPGPRGRRPVERRYHAASSAASRSIRRRVHPRLAAVHEASILAEPPPVLNRQRRLRRRPTPARLHRLDRAPDNRVRRDRGHRRR